MEEKPELPENWPKDAPVFDTIEEGLKEIKRMGRGNLNDRFRPYDGQAHTDEGERGKQIVTGLTMRDVADCFALGFFHAASHVRRDLYDSADRGEYISHNDLYGWDINKLDPGAVIKNAMCLVEQRMGIFPNIPKEMRTPENGGPPIEGIK